MRTASVFAVIGAVGLLAGTASAQIFSFNYQNLDSRYTANPTPSTGGSFSARAAASPFNVNTFGAVATNVGPNVETNFNIGFFGSSAADFQLNLNVSNIAGAFASGFGSFTITDQDGDTITGTISGDRNVGPNALGWNQAGFALFYRGQLTNVQFNQKPGGTDTLWNGTDGDSFDWTTLPGGPTFFGEIVQLTFNTIGGGVGPWFWTSSWGLGSTNQFGQPNGAVPSGLNAFLIPAPGAAALLGLGGLLAARRRR